eukprot:8553531-Alexandrium_andersonii.AAC.1
MADCMSVAGTTAKSAGPRQVLPLATKAHCKGPPPGLHPAVRPPPPVPRVDARSETEQWSQYNQGDHYEPDPVSAGPPGKRPAVAPPLVLAAQSKGGAPVKEEPVERGSEAVRSATEAFGLLTRAEA